jgi:hypothetical protein
VKRHASEAIRLVNGNRRVATVWYRNGGPQILQALLSLLQSRDRQIPSELGGKPASEALKKMQETFARYGSAEFAADLHRLGPRIIGLTGLTYNQALAALQTGGPH